MSRAAVIASARTWLRTPFHHEARVKGVGVDCAQLLIAVFAEAGLVAEFTPAHYPHDWHFHQDEERYLAEISSYAHRVDTPLPGDIALFRFGRCASHAAIVIDWPLCIHAYYGQGVVEVDAENGAELAGRLHSFWSVFEEEK